MRDVGLAQSEEEQHEAEDRNRKASAMASAFVVPLLMDKRIAACRLVGAPIHFTAGRQAECTGPRLACVRHSAS